MITKANWRKYIDRLSEIDKRAGDLMQAWINEHGLEDGEAAIQYAYALVTKYGEASATLASEMYDHMADIMKADVPEAIPAETASLKEVAKGVTWGKYHSPSQIPSVVSRQVRQAGADTMIQNAKRDHAQWAWIPQGDTCAFCITLASRGWQDASKTVLKGNHAEHIHQNCDCTFAIAFKEKDKRQYDYIYDPDKYLDMYNEAGGDINAMRRKIKRSDGKHLRKPYDVTKEYKSLATPGRGTIDYDKGLNSEMTFEEKDMAYKIHSLFGGNIHLFNFKNYNGKSPDYMWNNELWDLKSPQTINGIDGLLRTGLKQIKGNPGGIIVDVKDKNASIQQITNQISGRLSRKENSDIYVDILIFIDGEFKKILRYR